MERLFDRKADTMEAIIEKLKQEARKSWNGDLGEERAVALEAFLRKRISEYAIAFNLSEGEVLAAIEGKRNYSAINYYQEANFPSLNGVKVYNTPDDLAAAIPNRQFRCPRCGGISTDPYECNSGAEMEKGEICNWKVYGLFKALGKGFRFTIKEGFLEKPFIDHIFNPVDFE